MNNFMLIDIADAERRLRSQNNLLVQLGIAASGVIQPVAVLQPEKRVVTPPIRSEELRVVAGTQAHFKPAADVAAELGITEQQVKSAKNSEDPLLRLRIERSVEQVQEMALLRTLDVLGLLDAESISTEKPRDQAAIAASLSKVYANMRPASSGQVNNGVQFVVYAPQMKSDTHFEVVETGVA